MCNCITDYCNRPEGLTKCIIRNNTTNKIIEIEARDYDNTCFVGDRNPSLFDGETIKPKSNLKVTLVLNEEKQNCSYTLKVAFDDDTEEMLRFNQKACFEEVPLNGQASRKNPFRVITIIPNLEERLISITITDDDASRVQYYINQINALAAAKDYETIKDIFKTGFKIAERSEKKYDLKKTLIETQAQIFSKIGVEIQESVMALELKTSIGEAYETTKPLLLQAKQQIQKAYDASTSVEYSSRLTNCNAKIRGNEYHKDAADFMEQGYALYNQKRDIRGAIRKFEAAVQSLQYAQNQFGKYNDPILKASLEATIREIEKINLAVTDINKINL